ncbi:hypothetical protein FACS1894105_08830 [Clostridia bacterium]|nr:hypothetical protein FACS1894105_08830 [Clostridia bacterium]
MATVIDAAKYILAKKGKMTSMKLEKLVYYAQAWSLAWDEEPLFDEDFEAWANGPVCPELFKVHKGVFTLNNGFFGEYDETVFTDEQKKTLEAVLEGYGDNAPHELSEFTHAELPWKQARGGTPPGYMCKNVIEKEAMRDFYAGLYKA